MTNVYIVLGIAGFIFGLLLWLTRKYKTDGRQEVIIEQLELNLESVKDANEIRNKVDAMSDDDVANELRKRTRK
ncbi:MAG: hypothetical protein ACK6DA_01210 [Candidatus Kapaibacterium sp.]